MSNAVGRPKKYGSDAERVAAFRERKRLAEIEAERLEQIRQAEERAAQDRFKRARFAEFVAQLPEIQQRKVLAGGGYDRFATMPLYQFIGLVL